MGGHFIKWTEEQTTAIRDGVIAGLGAKHIMLMINERFGTAYSRRAIEGYTDRNGLAIKVKPRSRPPVTWTEEYTDAIRADLPNNYSAAQIAVRLNEKFGTAFTRCSVLGRVHRIGLSFPPKEVLPRKIRIVSANSNSNAMRVFSTVVMRPIKRRRSDIACTVPLADVTGCRFIDGDDHLYCNGQQQAKSSYCPTHHAIVYIPADERRVAA